MPSQTAARERQAEGPLLTREMSVASIDAAARTFNVVWSTGAPVTRRDWWSGGTFVETLDLSTEAVRLDRLNSGAAPLLDSHESWSLDSVLGVVVAGSAEVDGAEGRSTVRFPEAGIDARCDTIFGKVAGGIITRISVGYVVHTWEETRQEGELVSRVARDWEPYEISLVAIPADPQAGVRSASRNFACTIRALPTTEENTMPPDANTPAGVPAPDAPAAPAAVVETRAAPAAPAQPSAPQPVAETMQARMEAFGRIRSAFGSSADDQLAAMSSCASAEIWREQLIDARAAQDRATHTSGVNVQISRDARETTVQAMTDALVARLQRAEPTNGAARAYMDHGLAEMAAELEGYRGRLNATRRDEIMHRAFHTTSDFPALMGAAVSRTLLARYQAAVTTYRLLAAQRDLPDFRPSSLVRLGDFPQLLKVGETGEIKAGTVSESGETMVLSTYARQIRFSRNMIINDDLGGIAQVISSIGDRVAAFENAIFWAFVLQSSGAGPTLSTDSTAVFATAHNNLAGSGALPSVATIGAGRAALRKQKSLEKTADKTSGIPINTLAKYIVSGADHETLIEQITSPLVPQQIGNVNPFSNKLTPLVEPNITGNDWYLFADPSAAPVFSYGHLQGATGPQVRQEEPFGVLGVAWQVVLDFGVGAQDYRGAYRNPGAAPA